MAPKTTTRLTETLTVKQTKAVLTTRENALTLFCGKVNTETGEITEQYELMPTQNRGIYIVLPPRERVGVPKSYAVDVIGGTCECPQFANCGECKHCHAVADLVLRGIAPGMPAEFIADFYNPSLVPNADLTPEMCVASDDDDLPIDAPIIDVPTPKDTDIFGKCAKCGEWVPKGHDCFRCAGVVAEPMAATGLEALRASLEAGNARRRDHWYGVGA